MTTCAGRSLRRSPGCGRARPAPSRIARDLADDWRPLMDPLRRLALQMAAEGNIAVLQKGRPVGPDPRGPIRLARR